MIFPPDSLYALRREIVRQMASGELTNAAAFRKALDADPNDPAALRYLALEAERANLNTALNTAPDTVEELAWRWLYAAPLEHEPYFLIARLLARTLSTLPLSRAYMSLAWEKLRCDPEAAAKSKYDPPPPTEEDEPAAAAHELEPHRLLHSLFLAGTGEVERDVIDRVLARGADCGRLLLGVLNMAGEALIEERDIALVARALALIGEIGDASAVPALARFLPLDDETLSGAAQWAVQRIGFRRPKETLAYLQEMAIHGAALDLAGYSQQISLLPAVPGRTEALMEIAGRLASLDAEGRAIVLVSLITGAHVMEGSASPLANAMDQRYGHYLSRDARKELKAIRKVLGPAGAFLAEEDPANVYDLCCHEFEAAEEDDDDDE
jgi:hypothetical protein